MELVSKELDGLVVDYIDTFDKINEMRQRMHTALEQGFYNLSKARYSMGKGQVGALQFDKSRMRAQAHIKLSESHDGKYYRFLLEHHQVTKAGPSGSLSKEESTHCLDSKDGDIHCNAQDSSTTADFIQGDDEESPTNPLRWYGILVPSTLRQCQTNFINAIQECSHLATLEKRLLVIRDQFLSLQKEIQQQMSSDDNDEMLTVM